MLAVVREYPEVETTKDIFWEAQRDIDIDDVEWGRFDECPVYRAAVSAIIEQRSRSAHRVGMAAHLRAFAWFWSPIA